MKKSLFLGIFAVIALISLILPVSAQDYDIKHVIACDIVAPERSTGNAVFAERGQICNIEVTFESLVNRDRVRVGAWIGGYEYGSLEDETSAFDVDSGVLYKKTLVIKIPEDIYAARDYTLNVEIFDNKDSERKQYILRIVEKRHFIKVIDVLIRPNIIRAGQSFFTTVRVENLGQKIERDIKVTIQIPELGLSQSTYIDKLAPFDFYHYKDFERSESTKEMFLRVPRDVRSGSYNMDVIIEYDRGYTITRDSSLISIFGVDEVIESNDMISLDSNKRALEKGEVKFKVLVANFNNEDRDYTLRFLGNDFRYINSNPKVLSLEDGRSGEFYVTLIPNKGFEDGFLDIEVLSNGEVVGRETLEIIEGKDLEKRFLSIFLIFLIMIALYAFYTRYNK